eukprot:scaffold56234_cov53-Prasinocladus_malaysianus.AAC.1
MSSWAIRSAGEASLSYIGTWVPSTQSTCPPSAQRRNELCTGFLVEDSGCHQAMVRPKLDRSAAARVSGRGHDAAGRHATPPGTLAAGMQELSHPNIIQFLGACSKPPNLAMLTEYLPHSLFHVLHNTIIEVDRKRVLSLAKAKVIWPAYPCSLIRQPSPQDICSAFIYMHSRSPPVIHRDIKPANFLLDRAWKLK